MKDKKLLDNSGAYVPSKLEIGAGKNCKVLVIIIQFNGPLTSPNFH
jgi:hypothetical protein